MRVETIQLQNETSRVDEISSLVEGRYVTASEVVWWTFVFENVDRQPLVVRLYILTFIWAVTILYFNKKKLSTRQPAEKDPEPG